LPKQPAEGTFTPPVEQRKFMPSRPIPQWAPQFAPMPPRPTASGR
jgi:hypothetical protein